MVVPAARLLLIVVLLGTAVGARADAEGKGLCLSASSGSIDVSVRETLVCDGNFRIKSKTRGHLVLLELIDENHSPRRASCVLPTTLHTVVSVPPGKYKVVLKLPRGNGERKGTVLVPP